MNPIRKILNFFATLTAGITLGLLFAPKKGKDLRKKLADSVNDFWDNLVEASEDGSIEVKKFIKEHNLEKIVNSGKEKIEEIIEYLKDSSNDLSEKAKKELMILIEKATSKIKGISKKIY